MNQNAEHGSPSSAIPTPECFQDQEKSGWLPQKNASNVTAVTECRQHKEQNDAEVT
jgi:hypothetical protein